MSIGEPLIKTQCCHAHTVGPKGVVLITVGNSLRGDDGIASVICDALPARTLQNVCRFDLGTYTGHLSSCLQGHQAAIIIDATHNGTPPGTVSIVDLSTWLDQNTPLALRSCHGLSVADELLLARKKIKLPARLIFFGVEIDEAAWNEKLSCSLQTHLPKLVDKLSLIMTKVVETLKRDA